MSRSPPNIPLDAAGDADDDMEVPPLGTSIAEFRKLGKAMIDEVADYFEKIEEFTVVSNVQPNYLGDRLPDAAPEEPESFATIMSDVHQHIFPGITHWQHPSFHAFFPGLTSFPSILGSILQNSLNLIGFNWQNSPALTELETICMDWLGKALGLPESFLSHGKGGGFIQASASDAVLICALAARERARKHGYGTSLLSPQYARMHNPTTFELEDIKAEDSNYEQQSSSSSSDETDIAVEKLTAYMSDQTHESVMKALRLAGVLPTNIRILATRNRRDYSGREIHRSLEPSVLEKALQDDVECGLVPFFVCATLGSTSSCAWDRLSEIGPIAIKYRAWLHCDAAYAGICLVANEFRYMSQGLSNADSFVTNPHKLGLVSFDCSGLWLQKATSLQHALRSSFEIYRNHAESSQKFAHLAVNYRDMEIPLGHGFRSLKLWFVMRMYGLKGLRHHVRRHCALATRFDELVKNDPRFNVVAPTHLGLVCFRFVGEEDKVEKKPEEELNQLNERLLKAINDDGSVYMVHSKFEEMYFLRFVVCSPLTTEEHVDKAWDVVVRCLDKMLLAAAN